MYIYTYTINYIIFVPADFLVPSGNTPSASTVLTKYNDVTKWQQSPRYWPLVRGIHKSPVNSPHKGQGRGDLVFYFDQHLNKRLSQQSTSLIWDALHSLSYHCNERHVIFQNSKATNDYVSLPWTRFRHSKWQAICNLITFFHLASVFENMISRIVLCFDWMIHFNIRMLIHLFSSNTVSISYMTTSLSILTIVFSQISRTITPTTIFILLTNASVLSCLFSV